MAVDRIGVASVTGAWRSRWLEMRDELVAVQVEVNPMVGAATFRAAEDGCVEVAGGVEIIDGEGNVERLHRHTWMIPSRVGAGQYEGAGLGELAAVIACAVASDVGVAKGIAVDGERPQLRVVTWCAPKGAAVARTSGCAAVGICFAIRATTSETLAFRELDQRRLLGNRRRWWRRWRRIVGLSTAERKKEQCRR